MEIIRRGAEAIIYRGEWRGRKVVIKKRVSKKYRIKEIDEIIREQRTKREAMLMMAARAAGVGVPIIYDLRIKEKEIVMQYLEGDRIKDVIDKRGDEWKKRVCREIGRAIANMHKNNIIHGDITTSNMIWMNNKLYFIDFGLGMKSGEDEDRGVDLHLLMEAFKAAHEDERLFGWVIESYKENFDGAENVIKKVEEIAKRGRYMRRVS
ncbi:MAG TPA: Kae1-associated serine/threonine protein kinase [Thermoplasmatales archaeon]|nr:Kae1-associated serine/threonine protein kinase [Thermoplasmatales archaeon]